MASGVRRRLNLFSSSRREDRPSDDNDQSEATRSNDVSGKIDSGSSSREQQPKPITIHGQHVFNAITFLVDGKHFMSGDREGRIRSWRVEDGREVGESIVVQSVIVSLAASRDGRWIAAGMGNGNFTVWNAETRNNVIEVKGHSTWLRAIDISPDSKKIVTGSDDGTVCVWSLLTGQRILGPQEHGLWVTCARFSPDGHLIAAIDHGKSVQVYDTSNGNLFLDTPIKVRSIFNNGIGWASDGKRLFVPSDAGNIHAIDISTRETVSKWCIHSTKDVECIALACNDRFIVAAADEGISLWDTTTHEQIGPIIKLGHYIWSMCISANYDLVACGYTRISILNLRDTPLSRYIDEAHASAMEELYVQLAEYKQANEENDGLIQTLREQEEALTRRIVHLGNTVGELRNQLVESQQNAACLSRIIRTHEQVHECESMYAKGRIHDAAECLLEIMNTTPEYVTADKLISMWLPVFADRCIKQLQMIGDEALHAGRHKDAIAIYSTLLSISSSGQNTTLMKWANLVLSGGSVQDALSMARKFKWPMLMIYRAVCETLERDDRLKEAVECFRQMRDELPDDGANCGMHEKWGRDFQKCCAQKLEKLGDTARDSKKHDEAVEYYSELLLLEPANFNILLKHSTEVIEINPSSHKGFEGKHAALHGMGRYREAFEAFRVMVSKVERSPDSTIRKLLNQYVDATPAIQREINEAIRNMPTVLIDTDTGHLYDKTQQGEAFKELPIYDELRSSMTTHVDNPRIHTEVRQFYRYVMFSHRWQPQEPTFQEVTNTSVYKLPLSPKFSKLQNFCKIVCTFKFKWAWTDTCCVNQLDKGIQQESVVAMFKLYRGSALTIVHLLGVLSASQEIGRLRRSIWNMRGWTYQEYVASEVVRFYTEDWKPYLGLDISNHKESTDVLLEMEEAMHFTTRQLSTIQPGLDRVREKLYLASTRQTTREEDIAYSLFGIFNVALPVIYGEGLQAVGRLLEHVLTRLGDVTVLAWTGTSGSHHSYLPIDLTVYSEIVPPHIPPYLSQAEMESMTTALQSSPLDLSMAPSIYNLLYDLPPPSLVAGRLKLSGLVFTLDDVVLHSESDTESDLSIYHVTTPMLGNVEIRTAADLSEMGRLSLIHPWISPLLDRDFSRGEPQFDPTTCALRLVVRLRQSFGGLLLATWSRALYRRVATDCLIMVRIREEVSLRDLINCIRTVDIQ